jgi:hemoglobin
MQAYREIAMKYCNVKRFTSCLALLAALAFMSACATHPKASLYERIGGEAKVAQIADYFIDEIQYDRRILSFFLDSDIDRFREKLIEHVCVHIDGPCSYTGDDMVKVHTGMNITEADFNRVVELLIKAMTRADVPHRLQNQVLARFAPMRGEMIYR